MICQEDGKNKKDEHMSDNPKTPSNRQPTANVLMLRLAHEAWNGNSVLIPHGGRSSLSPSEHRAWIVDRFWEKRRPGAFIEEQSPEVREILCTLRSEDIADVGAFPDWYAEDEAPLGRVFVFRKSKMETGG